MKTGVTVQKIIHSISKKILSGFFIASTGLLIGIFIWSTRILNITIGNSAQIIDIQSSSIGELLSEAGNRHIVLMAEQIPPILSRGLILLEDRGFYEHVGVSPTALVRSLLGNLGILGDHGGIQGGSTITMGLARNIL